MAQLYAGNLEKALARRDAYEKQRAERVKSNVDAINKGIASVGRAVTYGTSGTAAEKLAALQKEYEEALVRKLIERIMVYDDYFTVEFKSGIEIDVRL